MALPSTNTIVAGHYNGVFTRANDSYVHYVSATADGFTFSQDIQLEPIPTDILGEMPLDYIYRGEKATLKCTMQRYDEAFYNTAATTGLDGTTTGYQAHAYGTASYGLIYGYSRTDPGLQNYVGQLAGELAAGTLVLTPAYSLANSRLPASITFHRALVVPGSVTFNTKAWTYEVTFEALPYWNNGTSSWRLFTITMGAVS